MNRRIGKRFALVCFSLNITALAFGFNPPTDTAGPLTVAIDAPDKVDALGKAFDATVSLANAGSAPLDVRLEVWVIDDWRIETSQGQSGRQIERLLRIAAGAKENVALKLAAGPRTYNALYPIHARATFADPVSRDKRQAHAIKIFGVETPRPASSMGALEAKPGLTPLVRYRGQSVALRVGDQGATRTLGAGWFGSEAETGATFQISSADRGGRMDCLAIHPPFRKGWGTIWADYDLILPDVKPITLTFSTAIRDIGPNEPPSDGVEFRVLVGPVVGAQPASRRVAPGAPRVLFTRFTKSKTWESASVDLSPYAGKRITLQLWSGPGPAHNTVCDSGFWGAPAIVIGYVQKAATVAAKLDRHTEALRLASRAREGSVEPWSWQIKSDAGTFGAAVVPGAIGLADAVIALSGGKGNLFFEGFAIQIDGVDLASIPMAESAPWTKTLSQGRGNVNAQLLCGGQETEVNTEIWTEAGALRFRFSMPGVKRDKRGSPRFTLLGLGQAISAFQFIAKDPVKGEQQTAPLRWPFGFTGAKPDRVYAGFGNVIEKPGKFDLSSDGFHLSTRHVGVDYDNGPSVVQASDVFPDRLQVDAERALVQLQVHHDATISLIPSEKGAFAAAKVYRDGIAGFKPAPGVEKLRGKMCLDYWGTSYQHGIDTVEKLAQYGVTDCVYVWHNWQRWGYDYRLPEIYPARGSHEEFLKLAETCRKHGILFCPHDNYIDFYPDAEGYSYDHIIFNEDGTPQRAWFNKGRAAQSYRWRPDSFQPWMKKNIALLKGDVKPTAYFTDVFTAIPPMDYYDRTGRFHPKTETIQRWGECFDYMREQFGGAPQISEAGSDHLIGHLDGGESDHNSVTPGSQAQWGWKTPCADAERTPWHDMASHGSFILFAGGLASRYVSGMDQRTHGYGSDDYLSLTVLGGRNPMAQGDSSAETILAYWLLHDICAELGKRPMTGHEFAENNIHRQIVRFGDDATVRVNRGKDDWTVASTILPQYGFVAHARIVGAQPAAPSEVRAEVTRRNGVVCAYAESPNALVVDARPPRPSLIQANTERKVIDFGPVVTNGAFRLLREKDSCRVIVLPGCPPSEIRLRLSRLTGQPNLRVSRIEKTGDDGNVVGQTEFQQSGDEVVFQTQTSDFGYLIPWR